MAAPTHAPHTHSPTIGVFDSGFGGLTVLRALLQLLPHAHFIYLGDTARLPYGSKSQSTVARYAVSSARFLLAEGADLLVIACNTASALALDDIRAAADPIPVIGVITPGAAAARALTDSPQEDLNDQRTFQVDSTVPSQNSVISTVPSQKPVISTVPSHKPVISTVRSQNSVISTEGGPQVGRSGETCVSTEGASPANSATVLVLATTATVSSGAYTAALAALGLVALEKACPLLVPLVEEGWIDHPVTAEVARIYLAEALAAAPEARTLLLGCTHYPLLAGLLQQTAADLGHPLQLVDSAHAAAAAVLNVLTTNPIANDTPTTAASSTPPETDLQLYATDSVEKFQRLGSSFLGRSLPPVQLVHLPE